MNKMNTDNTSPNYWAFKHKPGEGGEFECRPYVKMALENKCVMMQYEYGIQDNTPDEKLNKGRTVSISKNRNKILRIKEGDYIFLRGDTLVYAYGKVIKPRKKVDKIIRASDIKIRYNGPYRSDKCSLVLGYEESDVFYDDFSGKKIDKHGKWGERIDVEEWLCVVNEGISASSNNYYVDRDLHAVIRQLNSFGMKELISKLSKSSDNNTLFDAPDIIQEATLFDKIENEPPIESDGFYSKKDFLNEVYLSSEEYDRLVKLLKTKKNIILQGAPGVGKTYAAKRLAYSLLNAEDDSHIKFIQFHQNCSYEDFIMGYKPSEDGNFELKEGVFYDFCREARNNPDQDFFFIIDEINRGNLSKIFGELLVLIETSHRNETVTLTYNNESFSVPDNLYIIGMMNTADRSLAMIDYALRRRFAFFDVHPAFESAGFTKYVKRLNNDKFSRIIKAIQELNKTIADDDSLGEGFCIGHSYFCNQEKVDDVWLKNVIEFEILPMIKEYWFDNKEKYENEKSLLMNLL